MDYIAGIDGGASKTHCVIGDAEGNTFAEGFASGSSYHVTGLEAAKEAIESALSDAAGKIGIRSADIRRTVLGLASADLPSDFTALQGICESIFPQGGFTVLNDTWIGLRAGIPENWGIVTVCGTGGACAGRNRKGAEVRLRNLSYRLGNRGGGADIVTMALHYAFRSNEGTGRKTALEEELPKVVGLNGMEDIIETATSMKVGPEDIYAIPVLVGRLALQGDAVCQDILLEIGHELGEIAGGVVKRLGMEKERFRATLIGSVFNSECPLLIDAYTTALHRAAPYAMISPAGQAPAFGAYCLACEAHKSGK
jgi:N-acetylglucosamine kinase-like BadF-type ATPase